MIDILYVVWLESYQDTIYPSVSDELDDD